VDGLFDIVHGAPWDEDYYIFQWWQAQAALQRTEKQLTFFGHTHVPVIWTFGDDDELRGEAIPDKYYEYPLEENKRYLINPGSVGQPRDQNAKAALATLVTDEMRAQFFRIEYNMKGAQAKIRQAGLDRYLADRLAAGR
jgi:predicted phosphodiesterase